MFAGRSRRLIGWLTLLVATGCVNEYGDFRPMLQSSYLQIQGVLSNLPDGRTVTVYTLQGTGTDVRQKPEQGANVRLLTAGQEPLSLTATGNGRYDLPTSYSFVAGRTYQLSVQLSDGRTLRSTPETMPNPVMLGSVRAEFSPDRITPLSGTTKTAGHLIYGDFTDPDSTGNAYRLNWKNWERQFYCKRCTNGVLYREGDADCTDRYNSALGYVQINPTTRQPVPFFFDYTCNSPCWQQHYSSSVTLLNDQLVNGRIVRNVVMGEVPLLTTGGFLVECQLESLTVGYYRYLQSLQAQVRSSGGIADTPPAPIRGNVFGTDGSPTVGYFTVLGVSTRRLFVDRGTVDFDAFKPVGLLGITAYNPEKQRPRDHPPIPFYPCNLNEEGFRTPVRPEGWPN